MGGTKKQEKHTKKRICICFVWEEQDGQHQIVGWVVGGKINSVVKWGIELILTLHFKKELV